MNAALPTASWPRRIAALFIDGFASSLVVTAFYPAHASGLGGVGNLVVIGVLILETTVFTWLLAGSFGKLVVGLRVIPADGDLRPHRLLRVLVRQMLVALVIPPVVFKPDGRGLHDLYAGTVTVTVGTFRGLVAAQSR